MPAVQDESDFPIAIAGVGGLVDPAYPDIPGMSEFEGEMMHTARWNHEVDLSGKQVSVIGTGASAVQVVPAIEGIQKIRNEGLKYVDIRRDVLDRYNEGIQKRMKYMVWGGCKSWYLNPDGSNHSLYPGFAAEYVLRARHFKPAEYEIVK